MVTFTRYGGTDLFLEGPVATARCGVIARGYGSDSLEFSPALLAKSSFAIWDDLSKLPSAAVAEFFRQLALADTILPATRGVILFGPATKPPGVWGRIEFNRQPQPQPEIKQHAIVNDADVDIQVGSDWAAPQRAYRLRVKMASGVPTTLSVVSSGFVIRHPQPESRLLFLKVAPRTPTLRGDVQLAFTGADAPRFRFTAEVTDEGVFPSLAVVLRADFQAEQFGNKIPVPREFPLFRPYRPPNGAPPHVFSLNALIDPFDLAAERSGFEVSAYDGDGGEGLIETHLVTNYGSPVILRRPTANALRRGLARPPRLLFARQGNDTYGPFPKDLSLLPDGDFDLELPRTGERQSFGIMCGLSEREYVPIVAGQRLAFRAGRPAFAGDLPVDDTGELKTSTFISHTTSSWIAVTDADGAPATTVIAEDPDYSYFDPSPQAATLAQAGEAVVLEHRPMRLQPRQLAKPAAGTIAAEDALLPIYPWKGVKISAGQGEGLRRIENRIFTPNRRNLLQPEITALTAAEAVKLAPEVRYTPLGLEITVAPGGRMEALLLAKVGDLELKLKDIQPDLADALLRTNLFLVCDDLNGLAKLSSEISVASWGFGVDIPDGDRLAGPDRPVMIVKGRKGSLSSLLDQYESWALADKLCSIPTKEMAARIRALYKKRPPVVAGSDEAKAQDAAFKKIDEIYSDPDWTGILIFNVKLAPKDLPPQIMGLLGGAGDALKSMRAHHLGVDVQRLDPGTAATPTPLFGALAYAAKDETAAPVPAGGNHYAFALGRMVVSFENGQVRVFMAKGKLAIARLFDGEAKDPRRRRVKSLSLPTYPVIDIRGRYEARIQAGEKIDVYTFEAILNGGGQRIIMPQGGLLKEIQITRLTFATQSVDRSTPGHIGLKTQFLIDGDIAFNKWPTGGLAVIEDGLRFAFSGLGISFDFVLNLDSLGVSGIAFDFRPGGLSLDFSALPKMKSLLGKLPFKFRTFELWPEGIDFPKLGFTRLNAGREGFDDDGKYGFTFDLDLGSLGALAQKLKDFKLSLLLGFGYLQGQAPQFALGFKFAGSGGTGLDIGIGNILKLRANSYDVGKHPSKELYYAYALNAQLVIMGREIPEDAKLNVFLFIDPDPGALTSSVATDTAAERRSLQRDIRGQSPLSSVGWLGVMTSAASDAFISVDTLALGQRIQLFPGESPGPGTTVSAYVKKIGDMLGGANLPQPIKDALDKNDISVVTRELLSRITYAPKRAWTMGLSAKVARVLDFDILISDPDLYGIHINFKDLVNLDILYRKLSEDLGVYSVVIVPPAPLRRISAGAADIVLPSVGLDFYTDGGFQGSLGYPYNRDFSQSASVEILPFVGAGGLRAGLFKGGGSTLVPTPKLKDRYRYNPVIELGIGFRVGLGKSYESGPFRAGVSLTIFAYLEGAQGRLEDLKSGQPHPAHRPAETFYMVRGAFGIMGEIYGSVDFGIVKARVEIVIYVEASVQLRTDDHILLGFEAGVSVRVTVVVARFRVFGRTIEIRVSFSYSTTISYQTTLGSRRSDFDKVYEEARPRLAFAAADEWRKLTDAEQAIWLSQTISWGAPPLDVLGLAQKQPLKLWFMPDVTAAQCYGAAAPAPEAVFKLYLESELKDSDNASPYETLARCLTLWLLWSGVRDLRVDPTTADRPLDWTITDVQLQLLLAKITGDPDDPQGVRRRLPDYDSWVALYGACFELELVRAPVSSQQETRTAIYFPMPEELEILRYFPAGKIATRLDTRRFVTPDFEAEIEDEFAWMRAVWEKQDARRVYPFAATDKTLTAVLFEEFFGFLLRALAQAAERAGRDRSIAVADLLKMLQGEKGTHPFREAGSSASRFFNHGLALRRPSDKIWTSVRAHVPAPLAAIGDADPQAALPIFRYASLQLGLTEKFIGATGIEQVDAVGLRRVTGATWFTVAADLARIDIVGDKRDDDPIAELTAAAERLDDYARDLKYAAALDKSRIVSSRPRLYTPPSIRELFDAESGDRLAFVFELPADLTNARNIAYEAVKTRLRTVGKNDDGVKLECALAAAVPVTLRRTKGVATDAGRAIFEIAGARETERRLLDELSPERSKSLLDSDKPPTIDRIELFVDTGTDRPVWTQVKAHAAIAQANLSVDANPGSALIAEKGDPAFYASQSEAEMFAELFRRASIVNSGGFWLICDDEALTGDDVNLMMVVVLRGATSLVGANALIATSGQRSFRATSLLAGLTSDDSNQVAVIEAGQEERLLPRPGQLPLAVTVPNPSLGYYVADDGGPRLLSFEQLIAEASRVSGPRALALTQAMLSSHVDTQLRERFNLLEVLIAEDGDFHATQPSELLPVGDTAPPGSQDGVQPLDVPQILRFVHTLPLHHHLRQQASLNPYAVVGKRLHLQFRLRDINGNALPGRAQEASGALSGPLEVEYYDGLLDLSELPYLRVTFGPDARANRLRVTLDFDEKAYRNAFDGAPALAPETMAARANSARQAYQTALWQAEGAGFEFLLESTLAVGEDEPPASTYDLAKPARVPLDIAPLTKFYGDVLKLVDSGTPPQASRRREKKAAAAVAPTRAVLSVPLGETKLRAAFIEPAASLILRRSKYVHEEIKAVANAVEVRFEARPEFEIEEKETEREKVLRTFTKNLVGIVLGGGYVGAKGGPSVAGRPGASLWLIRKDVLPQATAPATGPNDPTYLGLPPLSNCPQTFEHLEHPQLETGDKVTTGIAKLVDVDMDVYGKQALERIDSLLAPRQILRMTGAKEGRALFATAMAVKEWLAGQLADRVEPILAGVTLPKSQSAAARDALQSKLMGRLSAAYEIDTLFAYDVLWSSKMTPEGDRPAIYGRLALTPVEPAKSTASELTMIAVPKRGEASSPLTVFYDALQPAGASMPEHDVDVGPLTITHIQRIPQPDRSALLKLPTEQRYRATQWLRLLDPWVVTQMDKRQRAPIVLRKTPERPSVTGQFTKAMAIAPATLANWRLWSLEASWSWNGDPADTPVAIIDYWSSAERSEKQRPDTALDPLARALLLFCLATDECWPRLMASIPPSGELLSYINQQLRSLAETPARLMSRGDEPIRDVIEFQSSGTRWKPKAMLQPGHQLGDATVVSAKEGVLAIERIDVMKLSRAHFSMELYRNRDFDLSGNGGARTLANSAFVYHLTGIAAGDAVVPTIVREAPLDSPRKNVSLADHFTGLLDDLFLGGVGRQRFDVHVSFAPRALPDVLANVAPSSTERDWPGVGLPGAIGLYSDRPDEWRKVAARLETWLAAAELERGEGHLQVHVKVYREEPRPTALNSASAMDTHNQPIFRAARLRIPLRAITRPATDVTPYEGIPQ